MPVGPESREPLKPLLIPENSPPAGHRLGRTGYFSLFKWKKSDY